MDFVEIVPKVMLEADHPVTARDAEGSTGD
jgi:hypothetical protein